MVFKFQDRKYAKITRMLPFFENVVENISGSEEGGCAIVVIIKRHKYERQIFIGSMVMYSIIVGLSLLLLSAIIF